MRIGIDCDGVLRDFISDLKVKIKNTHPEHADKILTPETWTWDDWLAFWTEDESEKYIRFNKLVSSAFSQRRKMLKNTLKGWNISKQIQKKIV